ncbi:histidine kinase [Amycolatopsis coloradensis]|uniref:Histidine kinase n=1 Tax=Amycolatopsis coloradensis TaxID=76021 RepID=A0ACD5BK03_9PSEU
MTSPSSTPRWWAWKPSERRHVIIDSAVALACVIGTFVWSGPQQFAPDFGFPLLGSDNRLIASIPLALLTGAAAMVRRRKPVFLVIVSLASWTMLSAIAGVVFGLYALAAFETSRRMMAVITAIALVAVGFPFWRLGGFDASVPISTALCLAPTLLGLWSFTHRKLVGNLLERASRLERERDLLAEQARAEERTRIARDMHDVVAHRVSLIVLHAATAEVSGDRERLQLTKKIRSIGRDALSELRQVLEVLRVGDAPLSPQPRIEDIAGLAAQSRAAGVQVDVETVGEVRPLPSIVEQASYRVAQEALTNVHKHARNADTRIRMIHGPEEFRLIITNQRPPSSPAPDSLPGGGFGIIGLQERIRLIGGTLSCGATLNGGYEVEAVIPLPSTGTGS